MRWGGRNLATDENWRGYPTPAHAWSDITLQLLDVRVGLDALHIIGRAILRFFLL